MARRPATRSPRRGAALMQPFRLGHRFSSGDRRAIRMGILLVAPALSYSLVVKPYVSGIHQSLDELQRQRALLQREEEITARRPSLHADSIVAATMARRTLLRMYRATDSTLAASEFGRDVTAALADAGLVIQRVETRDSTSHRGALQELTLEVGAEGNFESVVGAIARLEAHARLLRVSRLAIDRTGTDERPLSLVAVLHGYAQ